LEKRDFGAMTTFTQDQWIILALVFVLGLLIGMFLTAGGRRKWKTRYRDEVTRREALERDHHERIREWEAREKTWQAEERTRAAATGSRRTAVAHDEVPVRDERPLR
jgi:type VI protein secretion system component VasK